MNLSFLSSDQIEVVLVGVEIEAHTSSKSISESFFLVIKEFLLLVDNELELDNFLSFELVLHQVPVSNATVGGDRVEVQVLSSLFGLPTYLPDGIGVLGCSNG